MASPDPRGVRGLLPLLVVSTVVVLVAFGQARGSWLSNLHNGLLALAFSLVGAYVLFQRPGHPEGRLFLATGLVEAVLFLGRQIGHTPTADGSRWWGWLGVWPTVLALALTTASVIGFPDGRLPSPPWRWVVAAIAVVAAGCAALSAGWPVEYSSAGVRTPHPLHAHAPAFVSHTWSAVAHPAYAAFQLLWVLAIVDRWRRSGAVVRRQLVWLVGAAAVSAIALAIGLAGWQSPRAGLLTATLVPVAAGWAIVHGQHVAAYSALTWLSRAGVDARDRPTDLARAVAEALSAPGATLWMGRDALLAVGVWPESDDDIAPVDLAGLTDGDRHCRVVTSAGEVVGAVTVERPRSDRLSLAEAKLFDDLASQASLVLEHLGLADLIARERQAGHLEGLSPRERDVLELIARGWSNAAICAELHLSIKTVEPVVSSIFTKLGLHADANTNRRVLAALAFLREP